MTADAPVLPVRVALAAPLHDAVKACATAVQTRIEEELATLLSELEVPRRPVVALQAGDPQMTDPLVSLYVGGRQCRFVHATIAEAVAYVEGIPQVDTDGDVVLARLLGSDAAAARMAELLALVCRAAISDQPGILVRSSDDVGIRAALSLGMRIGGRDAPARAEATDGGDPVERLLAELASARIDVHVEPSYLRFLTVEHPDDRLFQVLRVGCWDENGLPLPPFHLCPDASLCPGGFAFRVNALRSLPRIGLPAGTILADETPDFLARLDIDAQPMLNPSSYRVSAVVSQDHRQSLEETGIGTWDPFGFLVLSLAGALRQRTHALMTRDVAASMLQVLGQHFPALERAAGDHAPIDLLAPVLRELLLDGVPIRNLRRIVELLLRYETGPAEGRGDRLRFVRSGMADLISSLAARGEKAIAAFVLDPQIEDAVVRQLETEPDGSHDVLAGRLSAALRSELAHLAPTAPMPPLLTRDDVRRRLRVLLRPELPTLRVLGYGDLLPQYEIQPLARLSWV